MVAETATVATDAEWAKARKAVYDAARDLADVQAAYDKAVKQALDVASERIAADTNKFGEVGRMFMHASKLRGMDN